MTFFIIILVIIFLALAFISLKLFRLVCAGIFALTHYFYMITDEYFEGVSDQGPFYVILQTNFWWLGVLYFILFLSKYWNVLTTDSLDFGWSSISFFTAGHIIMTGIAVSVCSSSGVNNVIENGILATILSFISMILTRGITIGSLLDGASNHVKGVLDKASDKKFKGDIDNLANSGPEGAAAAKHLIDLLDSSEDWIETSRKNRAKLFKIDKHGNEKKKS